MLNGDIEPKKINVIETLTEDERLSFLSSENSYSLKGNANKGIPSINITNQTKGYIKSGQAGKADFKSNIYTCFPSFLLASCSFDRELIKEMGEAIAKECITNNISAYLLSGAVLDSLSYGRGYELFGNDPFLAGELVASFSIGLQCFGVLPILTDYPIYAGEMDKLNKNICVDEIYLRERYLIPFEIAIKKADIRAIMAPSFKLNDIFIAENKVIDILKDELGFRGIVLGDWSGLKDRVKSLNAGVHIDMSSKDCSKEIKEAINTEVVSNVQINNLINDIFNFIEEAKSNRVTGYKYDKTLNHKIAGKIAEESICLLKNEDNILPLNPKDTIAVIGNAKNPAIQGHGASYIYVDVIDDPLSSIREISPSLTGSTILYSEGYDISCNEIRAELVYEACRTVMKAKIVVLFLGFNETEVTEGMDLNSLNLPENQIDLIDSLYQYNKNIVVVLNTPTCVNMPWIDKVKGIIDIKIPGEAIGPAIANILFGLVNPSGKLSCAYPGLFSFGYGLSYTDFLYSNMHIDFNQEDEIYYISFNLENIGSVHGKEVVLLYCEMNDMVSSYKRLIGFCKPNLAPGEKKKITFKVRIDELACYDVSCNRKTVYSSSYRFMICASEDNVKADITVYVEGDNLIEKSFQLPKLGVAITTESNVKGDSFTIDTSIGDLRSNRVGRRLYSICFRLVQETMGLNKLHPTYEMNMQLFLDMPVKRVATISDGKLTLHRIQGFIDLCNGKTLSGISKMLLA